MSEERAVTRAAGVVGLGTLTSRILGLVREVVVASFFGATLAADAFFVAFRIPNLLRRLFAEGSLTIAFVPVFTETLTTRPRREADELVNIAFTLLSIILIVVTLLGIVLAPVIVKLMVPGFAAASQKLELTTLLTRIMFPYIFFISLAALFMGILNSFGHFAAPAFSPCFLNVAIILSVGAFSQFFREPVIVLAWGVILGGLLQVVFQIPFLWKRKIRIRLNANFSHPAIKRIGLLIVPSIFGSAVYQLNVFISNFLASFLVGGSVSYLYYASRLVEFPQGIFIFGIGTVVLPTLSRHAANQDFREFKETLSYALRLVMFVTIPSMVGLTILRVPILSILFERGQFDRQTTLLTAQALLYYALGLCAVAGLRVAIPAFYSLQDTKTPVKIGVVGLFVNIVLSVVLIGPLRHGGLALATSLSAYATLAILMVALRRRLGRIGLRGVVVSVSRVLVSSAVMAYVVYGFFGPEWVMSGAFGVRILKLGASMVSAVAAYGGCCFLLRGPELSSLIRSGRHGE
jgi:putative peptidoglycan lipid II flippase